MNLDMCMKEYPIIYPVRLNIKYVGRGKPYVPPGIEDDIEQDVIAYMPPKSKYTLRVNIKKIRKAEPRPVVDCSDCIDDCC